MMTKVIFWQIDPVVNITPLDLGKDGIAYIKDYLKGWGGLADYIAEYPPKITHALAIVPENTNLDRAKQFDGGGFKFSGAQDKWLANYFLSIIEHYPEASIVMQDDMSQPTDGWLKQCDDRMFFHNNRVYAYLNSEEFTESTLEKTFNSSGHFTFGFFLDCKIIAGQKQDIGAAAFANYASHAQEIFVGAYDAESFILGC